MAAGSINTTVDASIGEGKNLDSYMPTVYSVGDVSTSTAAITTEYTVIEVSNYYIGLSSEVFTSYYNYYTIDSTNVDFYVDVTSPQISFFLTNTFNVSSVSLKFIDTNIMCTLSEEESWLDSLGVDSYVTNYFMADTFGMYNYLYLREANINVHNFLENEFSLASSFFYHIPIDIYSTYGKQTAVCAYDVGLIEGRITKLYSDVVNSRLHVDKGLYCSVFSSEQAIDSYKQDVGLILGNIRTYKDEVISSAETTTKSQNLDVRLNSLHIDNFSLSPGKFAYFGTYLSVDIIDYLFTVEEATTYFEVNGVRVNTIFENIPRGVRAKCLVDTHFIAEDKFVCRIIAHNTMGDLLSRDYTLLYGYSVEYDGDIFHGYNKEVTVLGCAYNTVSCPHKSCNAFTFTTQDYPSYNLGAAIRCVVSDDLNAEIYPQSTAFFYGKEYTITISGVKDFAGNYMDTVKFVFRIEEKLI